jgi:hypothetical protein
VESNVQKCGEKTPIQYSEGLVFYAKKQGIFIYFFNANDETQET